jgi:uncharacterized protein (TIGR02231 family)
LFGDAWQNAANVEKEKGAGMRRFLFIVLLGLHADSFAIDASSRIDAVALYPSGAIITRVASVDLPAGTSTVRLSGLVTGLEPDGLRVDASADGVVLGQLRFARTEQRDAFNAEVNRLNEEIRAMTARLAAIADAIKSAELRLKFLNGVAEGYAKEAWRDSAQGTANVGTWRDALNLLETSSSDAYSEIRRQNTAREESERELSVLQRELASLRGGSLSSSVLEISVQTPRAVSTVLRVHYLQDDAAWSPQYEARLDSDSGRLRIVQQALIQQDTDESWDNVSLSLSTSDPSGDLEPGELDPEFLGLADPAPAARPPARQRLDAYSADSVEEIVVTGAQKSARVGNYAVSYDIPGRVSVSNEADEAQSFDISALETDVTLVTRVIPRNSEQAFLAARFMYERNEPLYSSELRVFVDGAFAGVTEMPTALPNTEVTVPMGMDRRVEVRALNQGTEMGRSGIVSRRQRETTNYLFEISNRRQSASLVEVLDLYPQARDRDIEVDIARNSTAPTESNVDQRPGVILWRKSLGANERWQIHHEYTVSWPAGKRLTRQ